MDNESFENALVSEAPPKRKRSSILRPPEKRVSRDSRTVSFNITNYFLGEDMDLTTMDIVDHAQVNCSIDMSLANEQTFYKPTDMDVSLVQPEHGTLNESEMIAKPEDVTINSSVSMNITITPEKDGPQQPEQDLDRTLTQQEPQQQQQQHHQQQQQQQQYNNASVSMNITQKTQPQIEAQSQTQILNQTQTELLHQTLTKQHQTTLNATSNTMLTQISDISSLSSLQLPDETLYGAFNESNNLSTTSGIDSMMNHVEALDHCCQRVDDERRMKIELLDQEIEELFKFYRHIVNKNDKYEFAIAIFGLRRSLWLIIKVDPETYPNEKLNLKFAVNKKDRHLYPFADFAESVRRCTKEGSAGYLTRFVINAQRFRRFLRKVGHRKTAK